jgi:hypothetical protein
MKIPSLSLLAFLLSARCLFSQDDQQQKLSVIESRLQEQRFELDRPTCGKAPWASAYAKLHTSILESNDPKLLVAFPHASGEL